LQFPRSNALLAAHEWSIVLQTAINPQEYWHNVGFGAASPPRIFFFWCCAPAMPGRSTRNTSDQAGLISDFLARFHANPKALDAIVQGFGMRYSAGEPRRTRTYNPLIK
jgi:hypothetical protein